jgi:hypothetical protein
MSWKGWTHLRRRHLLVTIQLKKIVKAYEMKNDISFCLIS